MKKVTYRKISSRGASFIVGSDGSIDGIKYFAPNKTTGYMTTSRQVNGKTVAFRVHTLVALAFLEKPVFPDMSVIDHIDGNKLNNAAENLRWCTYEENAKNAKEKNCTRVVIVSVLSGESHVFCGLADAAEFLHSSYTTIYKYDESGKPLRGEWLINIKRKKNET